MARLILTGAPAADVGASDTYDVTGTNGAETINVVQNGKATFDGSFNRGNDIINIAGNAGTYQIRLVSSNTALITNATGASLTIPVGAGVTIKFADADARVLQFNTSGAAVFGTQALSGTAVTVTPGSGGNNGGGGTGDEIFLEVTRDNLAGTTGADLFVADIVQNQNGEQTNSLGTGDRLEGRGGVDTLAATLQEASALNGSPGSAIQPITNSVEEIYVTAQHAFTGSDGDDEWEYNDKELNLGVQVNARSMMGVTDLGSVNSDASLTFYNVNTLDSGSVVGDDDGRITAEMTVRMDHTGPSSPNDDAANLTVLFDNDYLLRDAPTEAGSQLRLQLLDIDNQITSNQPLRTNPFDQLRFTRTINGVVETYTISYNPTSTLTNKAAYDELAARINAALDANPALTDLNAVVTTTFTVVDPDGSPGGPASGFNIVITNSGPGQLDAVGFLASGIVPPNTDYQKQVFAERPSISTDLITVEVELEKVGRGGDGGYLTIGGMAQLPDAQYAGTLIQNSIYNGGEYDDLGQLVDPIAEETGVERFNVVVEGNSAQPSSLAGLQSTHNTLVYVQVTNPGSTAKLTIGNSNTEGSGFGGTVGSVSSVRNNAVKDVLIFDAGAFTADSEVWAHFSDETTSKYLNLRDSQSDSRADNVDSPYMNAVYTFGSGNNVLNMNVDKLNAAYQGAITREDFELDISMGAGNDTVQFQIGDGSDQWIPFTNSVANWYTNHAINEFRYVGGTAIANDRYVDAQVNIYTGTGADTVELWGSSAVHVELGDGDDTIYTDNSGVGNSSFNEGKAVWVFNSMDDLTWDVQHLQSQTRTSVTGINNLAISVTFQDIEIAAGRTVYIGGSNASGAGVTITDLSINQAIKDAINNDPVLSKLLVAQDGPSGTLLVSSLVDGVHANTDLVVSVFSTPLTTGQTGRIATAADLATLGFSATGVALGGSDNAVNAALNPSTYVGATNDDDRWYSDFGLGGPFGPQLAGADSVNTNTNVIEGGAGNDVIVLSTHGETNSTRQNDGSTETIDIDGVFTTATGLDTVLNFTAAVANGAQPEIQTITFTGTAAVAGFVDFDTPPANNGINSDAAGNNYTIADVPFAAGTTAAQLATAVAAAINAASPGLATANGGTVTLNYAAGGGNIPQSNVNLVTTGANEVQTIVLDTNQTAGIDDSILATGTVQATFGPYTVNVTIAANDTPNEVGAKLEAAFDTLAGADIAAFDAATNTLTLTNNTSGNVNPASLVISQQATSAGPPQTYALDYDVNTTTEGTNPGITAASATTQDGVLGIAGYDIFDLTTVMGAPVPANFINDRPGNGAEEDGAAWNEGARVQFATLNGGSIVITDTLSAADYSATPMAGTSPTTELARIQAIATAADTTASTAARNSVVITVDTDNVGHFYHISNGTAAGDTVVTLLGNIELATYDDVAKTAVGDWDTMTVVNFTPLTAESVVNTFFIA